MRLTHRLINFRSFQDTGDIELSPLTILCGANSSGKSSIIKSILLLKQSTEFSRARLLKDAPSQPLLFNGALTRLGSWTDVVRGRDRKLRLAMAWGANGTAGEVNANIDFRFQRRYLPNQDEPFDSTLYIEFRSNLSDREEISTTMASSTLCVFGASVTISEVGGIDAEEGVYFVTITDLRKLLRSDYPRAIMTSHRMSELLDVLSAHNGDFRLGNVRIESSGPFVTAIRPVLDSSWVPFFDRILAIVYGSRSAVPGRKPQWHSRLSAAIRAYKARLQSDSELKNSDQGIRVLYALITAIFYEINAAEEAVRGALVPLWKRIRYLGPLRHQPQRFYEFDDTGGIDIGVSGEFTVQVLAIESGNAITYTGVQSGAAGEVYFDNERTDTLLESTNYWLNYMGLPPVAPDFLRQSLYGLKVGKLEVALPDVGFGVSQVLPVIVEALRATAGDTVILEQPEIHLHPAVQAKLADFILSRNRDGVRFLVETHSEYLIKRACRRIAEGTLEGVEEFTNILFVEPLESGVARCRKVELNEFGEITNWPAGFFDEQEDLYWTKATLKRRMASGIKKV